MIVAQRVRAAGHPTFGVTCRGDSPLAGLVDAALVVAAGDESAIVMTRSFASMLALLLRVIADLDGSDRLVEDLDALPAHWPEAQAAAGVGRRLGATNWSRVVILGGGPAFGIASEWGLKLTETSQIPVDVFQPLEFRHGPIAVCEPGVLVVALLGGPGAHDEERVVRQAAALGVATWTLTCDRGTGAEPAGQVSSIGAGLHPSARLPLLMYPAHALALTLALTRGRDPDAPRHLGQVVVIGPE
jgi:glucosamine--fructose-6-phosphate aminotransferase (isomerizing)